MKKKEIQIFDEYVKKSLVENLKKICENVAHKEFFEREKKTSIVENLIAKDVSMSYVGFFYESEFVYSLLKISSINKIYSFDSLASIATNIIKNLYTKRKVNSTDLVDKVLLDFVPIEDIHEEIEQLEGFLLDNKNIKDWIMLSPLFGVGFQGKNELSIGACKIFILDDEKQKRFVEKEEKKDFDLSLILGSSPRFIKGNAYLETTAFGYHGGVFEKSKVVEEAEEKIKKCYSILKLIVKIFKLKRKGWLSFVHPNYWFYVYEEGNEKNGTYCNMDEELIIARGTYDITEDYMEKFINNYPYESINRLLINVNPNQIERRILRALEWFSSGFSEKNESHRYIQYCVALESLLGKQEPLSPLTVEIAERVAFLWTNDVNKRVSIKSDFRNKIFSLRGRILHSGHSIKDEELEYLSKLERAVVVSIVQILKQTKTIKNDNELSLFFDHERFFPRPSPEYFKQLDEIKKSLDSIQKKEQ